MNSLTPEVWKSWKPNRLHESELWEAMQLALNGNTSAVIALLRHIKALERDIERATKNEVNLKP